MESRVQLGGKGALPDNYLFKRREMVEDPRRNYGRMKLGIGGVVREKSRAIIFVMV